MVLSQTTRLGLFYRQDLESLLVVRPFSLIPIPLLQLGLPDDNYLLRSDPITMVIAAAFRGPIGTIVLPKGIVELYA